MKRYFVLLAMIVLAGTGCATMDGQSTVIQAKDKVAPALVHVRPVKEVYTRGKREEIQVVGSGFVISPDGYVVTNEHVAGESKFVRCVLYDKEEMDAQVVGTDPYTDLAVLKLDVTDRQLPYVKLGDSSKMKAGQTVLAMGSPHGLARSVSKGIISVTDRYLEDRQDAAVSPFNTWIQTDAAINFGNSGGPLVNLKGEVIGVNARVLAGAENVGFAIPVNTVKEVVEHIRKNGRVVRSWIGESLQPMTAKTDDPSQKGVVIADVDPLSPGHEAGLQPGDVMLTIDGDTTNARYEEDLPAVRKRIADIPVGKQVTVHIKRGDQELDIPITTAEKSQLKGEQVEFPEWGFTAVDLTASAVRQAQLPSKKGIMISGTQAGGLAANAELQNGDLILKLDNTEVLNLEEFTKLYRTVVDSKKRLVLLDVKRGALTRFTLIKQDGETDTAAPAPAAPTTAPTTNEPEGDGSSVH